MNIVSDDTVVPTQTVPQEMTTMIPASEVSLIVGRVVQPADNSSASGSSRTPSVHNVAGWNDTKIHAVVALHPRIFLILASSDGYIVICIGLYAVTLESSCRCPKFNVKSSYKRISIKKRALRFDYLSRWSQTHSSGSSYLCGIYNFNRQLQRSFQASHKYRPWHVYYLVRHMPLICQWKMRFN